MLQIINNEVHPATIDLLSTSASAATSRTSSVMHFSPRYLCTERRSAVDFAADTAEEAAPSQPLRLADPPADPDVPLRGLPHRAEQLRVSVPGAQRCPQPHRPGAAGGPPRATAPRYPQRRPVRGHEVAALRSAAPAPVGGRGQARGRRGAGGHHLDARQQADEDDESAQKAAPARLRALGLRELRDGQQPQR